MKDDSSYHITYFQSSDVQILWSHHPFRLLALFSVIWGLAIAVLPWMLDMWSSRRTGFARWILSSGVTFAAVVLSFLDTILFNVRRSLSVSFGFRPLVLVADDVFPWLVYAVITMETAAMDTPNKVAVLVIDAPAKRAPIICPFW